MGITVQFYLALTGIVQGTCHCCPHFAHAETVVQKVKRFAPNNSFIR